MSDSPERLSSPISNLHKGDMLAYIGADEETQQGSFALEVTHRRPSGILVSAFELKEFPRFTENHRWVLSGRQIAANALFACMQDEEGNTFDDIQKLRRPVLEVTEEDGSYVEKAMPYMLMLIRKRAPANLWWIDR